jgi:hypothetical protein
MEQIMSRENRPSGPAAGRLQAVTLALVLALSMGCTEDTPGITAQAEDTPARCQDGKDNDNDGLTDCKDSGCAALAVCKKDGGAADAGKKDGPGKKDGAGNKDGPGKLDGAGNKDGPGKLDGPGGPDQAVQCTKNAHCSDGIVCTTDLCVQGKCQITVQAGYCAIKGVCAANGTINPSNKCQKCNTSVSNKAWSPHPGTVCDDKNACTHSDTCVAGACKGTAYSCNDNLTCTKDTCTGKPNGCSSSLIAGNCLISGVCRVNGAVDPANKCQRCDSATATTSWGVVSPTPAGCPWAVGVGGAFNDIASDIAVDSAGNSYAVGLFKGTAKFGTATLVSKGDMDLFVVKVGPTGAVAWATSAGGSGFDNATGVAVDSAGNVTIVGSFKGTATFGGSTRTTKGGSDMFVARLSSSGGFSWITQVGSTGDDFGLAVALDKSGNPHALGKFSGTLSVAGKSYVSVGGADNIVVRFNTSGQPIWGAHSGGIGGENGTGIAVDSSGGVTFTGTYFSYASFGTITISNSNIQSNDIYVAKVNSSGSFVWALTAGSSATDYAGGVALDGSGNSYISGSLGGSGAVAGTALSGGKFFLAKISSAGKVAWLNPGWAALDMRADNLAADSAGNIYGTGSFSGSLTLGSTKVTSAGLEDMLAFRVNSSGSFTWATAAGGAAYDYGYGVALTSSGDVLITGTFQHKASFGLAALTLTATSTGDENVFIYRPKKP